MSYKKFPGKMISCLKGKRHGEDERKSKKFFIKNGAVLLEELVVFSNGKPNPVRHFSKEELLRATNYFDTSQMVVLDDGYQFYKGYLKDLPILVKKYDNNYPFMISLAGASPYKDIAVGSQLRAHKNVLKVLGYCLETEIPTIVYEYAAGTKTLSSCFSSNTNVGPLPWKCRLKIAADLANAITYLHIAFHRPIIHRDINCSGIILDENNVPKLIGFDQCISIPEGQSYVDSYDAIGGIRGGLAPDYYIAGNVTEKLDVYLFGKLLADLFTGNNKPSQISDFDEEPCIENISKFVDPRITQEGIEVQQLLDFVKLFARCMFWDREKRPTMIDVAKELRRIFQSF